MLVMKTKEENQINKKQVSLCIDLTVFYETESQKSDTILKPKPFSVAIPPLTPVILFSKNLLVSCEPHRSKELL